jgi:menaquinol-cytochrome c reductase iron-sulfur subunit
VSDTVHVHDEPESPAEISRRTFMTQATIIAGTIVGLGVAIPVLGGLVPSKDILDAGKPKWYPLNADEFAQFEKAAADPMKVTFPKTTVDGYLVSKSDDYVWGVKMTPDQEAQFKADRSDLFQAPRGGVTYDVPVTYQNIGIALFSPICPHLGCRFDWNKGAQQFLCPCHGSTYTKFGKHMAGPANRGLDPLPFQDKSGIAQVTWLNFEQTTADRMIVSYS